MKNTLIAMSCLVTVSVFACTSSPKRVVPGGTAGAPGSAGAGTAGAGTAGDTGGSAGAPGTAGAGTAGDQGSAGAVGGTAGAGTAGDQGTDAGTAGAGTAGDVGGTAGTVGGTAGAGTAGATVVACMNSTVVSAGGNEANCGAKTGWTATAMPTPASGFDQIQDNQLLPKYAIDGSLTTRYTSGKTMASGYYLQVDLGAAKMVSGIVVTSTMNMDGTFDVADGYTVGLSTDGNTFTTVGTCATSASSVETINFTATSARYVRYTNMGPPVAPPNSATAWLSIQEFDVTCN
jgi:F5/8 type C domain